MRRAPLVMIVATIPLPNQAAAQGGNHRDTAAAARSAATPSTSNRTTQAGELSFSNAAFTTPTDQIGTWFFYGSAFDAQGSEYIRKPNGDTIPTKICSGSGQKGSLRESYDYGLQVCSGAKSLGGCLQGQEWKNLRSISTDRQIVYRGSYDWPMVAVTADRKQAFLFCYRDGNWNHASAINRTWINTGGAQQNHPGKELARKYCEVMSHKKCDLVWVADGPVGQYE